MEPRLETTSAAVYGRFVLAKRGDYGTCKETARRVREMRDGPSTTAGPA